MAGDDRKLGSTCRLIESSAIGILGVGDIDDAWEQPNPNENLESEPLKSIQIGTRILQGEKERALMEKAIMFRFLFSVFCGV